MKYFIFFSILCLFDVARCNSATTFNADLEELAMKEEDPVLPEPGNFVSSNDNMPAISQKVNQAVINAPNQASSNSFTTTASPVPVQNTEIPEEERSKSIQIRSNVTCSETIRTTREACRRGTDYCICETYRTNRRLMGPRDATCTAYCHCRNSIHSGLCMGRNMCMCRP